MGQRPISPRRSGTSRYSCYLSASDASVPPRVLTFPLAPLQLSRHTIGDPRSEYTAQYGGDTVKVGSPLSVRTTLTASSASRIRLECRCTLT